MRRNRWRPSSTVTELRSIETEIEEEEVPVLKSLLDHKILGREFKRGLEQGRQEGREEARQEARHEGEAKMLRHQLEHRYKKLPKWVVDKLATATTAQIELWAVRLVEEKSLAAIFGRD